LYDLRIFGNWKDWAFILVLLITGVCNNTHSVKAQRNCNHYKKDITCQYKNYQEPGATAIIYVYYMLTVQLDFCYSATTDRHTHTHIKPFYCSLDSVCNNKGEPVPEDTFNYSHLSWSSVISYLLLHLLRSIASPCSIYMPDSLFPQSLSKFSFVYLLAWHPPLRTPYISSPNHCLLLATKTYAHNIATSFAEIPRLCHLILVSPSTLYLELLSCSFTPHINLRDHKTWPVRKENEVALQRAKMRMVGLMCGVKLQDRIPSKGFRQRLRLEDIFSVLH